MRIFFTRTHEKYINCLQNSNIVSSASTISTTCSNEFNSIDATYFQMISDSTWKELAKSTVTSGIVPGFKNSLQTLSDFLSNNLLSASELAINSLLPTVIMIRDKQEELYSTVAALNSTRSNKPENEEDVASWDADCNALESKRDTLIAQLEALCENVTSLENAINSLGEAITIEAANAIISGLNDSLINIDDIKNLNNYILITVNNLIESSNNSDSPLYGFKFDEKSYFQTDDGGFRISFTYVDESTGKKEKGYFLVPANATTNNNEIFAFLSGSGGLSQASTKKSPIAFGNTNPSSPIIVFDRYLEVNGDYEWISYKDNGFVTRNSAQISCTQNAIDAFKNYFGNDSSKINLVGQSLGVTDANLLIAKNPDYYDTYISMSGTASSYGNVDLNNSFKNSSTNFVVFVPTKDISIESFRQYESWKDSGFNVDYYYAPTDNVSSENKGINKYQNNIDVVYNQISDKFPEKISLLNNDKKWVSLDKQSWDSIRTDNISSAKVVFVENGGHSDPIGFLSDDEFYIWLNNFV